MAVILIVDDDPLQANILKVILSDEGYETHVALSAEEALSLAKRLKFDLVMTDFFMKEMDGIDLMKRLSSQTYAPEIIIMSAFGDMFSIKEAVRKGACRYIEKPLERDKVLLNIKHALESSCQRKRVQ